MAPDASTAPRHSNAYNIFILVLTLYSLVLMVIMLLPLSPATIKLATVYDNTICVVFLFDFFLNLFTAPSKREYVIGRRGWLDLLGSIPSFGVLRLTALLRLARLSRLTRITRLLRGENKTQLVDDVLHNRGQYAAFITILAAGLVVTGASFIVLQVESTAPDSNITTGGDALWWAVVTITTVGYGDRYPVTTLGRGTAMVVMIAGVGIIGALASILASILIPPATSTTDEHPSANGLALQRELTQIRTELAALRDLLTAERRASIEPWDGKDGQVPGGDDASE